MLPGGNSVCTHVGNTERVPRSLRQLARWHFATGSRDQAFSMIHEKIMRPYLPFACRPCWRLKPGVREDPRSTVSTDIHAGLRLEDFCDVMHTLPFDNDAK